MIKNKFLIYIIVGTLIVFGGLVFYRFSISNSTTFNTEVAQPLEHNQIESIKDKLSQLLLENDPKASSDYLRSSIMANTALARECHPLLHHLGQEAYAKYKDFNKTVSYQDGLCNSGYTHGAIEAHFKESSDIQSTLQTTCPTPSDTMSFQLWQCYHGIGHGIMYFTGKDLPQSLSLCEIITPNSARSSCVNGVFMERFIIVSHSGTSSSNDSDININLCDKQLVIYKSDCYFYAPTAYLELNTNDYTGAFENCEKSEERYVYTCISGVGGQAMKDNITRPDITKEICFTAPKKYVNSCIDGAIGLLINHNGTTNLLEPLCDTIFNQYNKICTEKIKSWNSIYNS